MHKRIFLTAGTTDSVPTVKSVKVDIRHFSSLVSSYVVGGDFEASGTGFQDCVLSPDEEIRDPAGLSVCIFYFNPALLTAEQAGDLAFGHLKDNIVICPGAGTNVCQDAGDDD